MAHTMQMQTIFFKFWKLNCIMIDYYRNRCGMVHQGPNRPAGYIASGILIWLIQSKLPSSFFAWLGETSHECQEYLLQLCQETKTIDSNNTNASTTNLMAETTIHRPLLSHEHKLTQTIFKNHIEPIFLPTTMLICDHHSALRTYSENESHLHHHALKHKSHDMSEQTEDAIAKSNEAALSKVVF